MKKAIEYWNNSRIPAWVVEVVTYAEPQGDEVEQLELNFDGPTEPRGARRRTLVRGHLTRISLPYAPYDNGRRHPA
jgi:hypothetical protein